MNSNYRLDTERGRYVVRIYEHQSPVEIEAEWRLGEHFVAAGAPVARRCGGGVAGAVRVGGRPVGVFEWVAGRERAPDEVDASGMASLGAALAGLHQVGHGSGFDRRGRFGLDALAARLDGIARVGAAELVEVVEVAGEVLAELRASWPVALSAGVVHGDLFPANVRWQGGAVAAVLDWEYASRGPLLFDVMVGLLGWCWRDGIDGPRARAWVEGYAAGHPLTAADRAGARAVGLWVALRFTLTRITDFHLRPDRRAAHAPDFRPFFDRLVALRRMGGGELEDALFGGGGW